MGVDRLLTERDSNQSARAARYDAGAFLTTERVPRRSDLPPRGFIPTAMHLAMVPSAQRHGKLIADLATESPSLGKAQMMRIRRAAPADETRLLGADRPIRGDPFP